MSSPLWARVAGFTYLWIVFGVTFGMKAAQSGVKPYYISGLLNSGEDTVAEFVIRWTLWGSIPIVLFRIVRRRLSSPAWAWALLVSWYIAIATGVNPRVFDGPSPSEALQLSHYVASGLVLLVSSLVLLQIQKWLGWFWIVVTVVYCSTFLVSRFSDEVDIPAEIYIATEYTLYLTMGVVVVLMPPSTSLTSAPLEEVRVERSPRVNILAREREVERVHR